MISGKNMGKDITRLSINYKKPNMKKLIFMFVTICLVCFSIVALLGKVFTGGVIADAAQSLAMTEKEFSIAQNGMASNDLGDDFYKQASGNSDIKQQQKKQVEKAHTVAATASSSDAKADPSAKEKTVVVGLKSVGRQHPFLPFVDINYSTADLPLLRNLAKPPTQVTTDQKAVDLMATTISGIMYDAFSPSAIVSVEGQDHLVKKGDRINGYKILNITKDRVVVQNGTNIYRASVGETLTTDGSLNFNNVYNIEHKFGGSSAAKGTKMLVID